MNVRSKFGLLLSVMLLAGAWSVPAHSEHEHAAPHGGALVDLGEGVGHVAHVEFVLDKEIGRLTAYVLDGEAENGIRLEQESIELIVTVPGRQSSPVELAAVANELTGEVVGDTSEFSATVESLIGVESFDAEIVSLYVKGKEFSSVMFGYPVGNE